MGNCEFRCATPVELAGPIDRAAVSGKKPICEVKLTSPGADAAHPICELPEASTETCPIAQFQIGNIPLDVCNEQLTVLFDARRQQREQNKH